MGTVSDILTDFQQASLGKLSGVGRVIYRNPDPFTVPTDKSGSIPKEVLLYSADTLEEIMFYLNEELNRRGNGKIQWRKYTRATNTTIEFELFTPNKNGKQLRGFPLKFFSQYVIDIQVVIDALIGDNRVRDSRDAYLARVFANNTSGRLGGRKWKDVDKIKDGVNIIDFTDFGDSTRIVSINPLTNIKNGEWPFTEAYIRRVVPFFGISHKGVLKVKDGAGSLESGDPNWPQSVIGRSTPSGIGGIDIKMRKDNRPFRDKNGNPLQRVHTSDTSQGIGAGTIDADQGYSPLAHFPHVVQMLRYQPPQVEWFPNNIAPRDYVSSITSTTTPNLEWVLAQPIFRTLGQNWGGWIVGGLVGFSDGKASITAYQNPRADEGVQGSCPQNLFFPDPTEICSCQWIETAFIFWFARGTGLFFDNRTWAQNAERAIPLVINKNTVMRSKFSTNASQTIPIVVSPGEGKKSGFAIQIKTERIGLINSQSWITILGPLDNEKDINIMNKLASSPLAIIQDTGEQYSAEGVDRIIGVRAIVQTADSQQKEVALVDGPGGSFIPEGSEPTCELDTINATIDYISIEEPAIVGDPVSSYL